jgi:hypothetical protein
MYIYIYISIYQTRTLSVTGLYNIYARQWIIVDYYSLDRLLQVVFNYTQPWCDSFTHSLNQAQCSATQSRYINKTTELYNTAITEGLQISRKHQFIQLKHNDQILLA